MNGKRDKQMNGWTDRRWTLREIEGLDHFIIFLSIYQLLETLTLSTMNLIVQYRNELDQLLVALASGLTIISYLGVRID